MQPVLHSVNRFCELYGLGKTKAYDLINAGTIDTVRVGRKRLIVDASARRALLGEVA